MTESAVFPLVLRLSVPTVISMLITSIYNMADTVFVSSLGNDCISAVGVVYSIQSVIQAIGFGFGMGAQSIISRRLGEKKYDEANLYAASALIAALLCGSVILGLGMIDLPFVMRLFGSTETALAAACRYGAVILIGAPVFCASFVLNNVLRAQGKASLSMVGLCCGGVLNIGLDALFIFGLEMGVVGAALATVISQAASFSILLSFFLTGKSVVKISPLRAGRHIGDYFFIFRTGLPTVFRQGLGSVATTLLNRAVRPWGDAAMAAVSLSNKIYILLRSMLIGVGQGFQPVVGYNYGAGKNDRARSAFHCAILIGTCYGFIAAVVLWFFPESLMGLFRPGDTEVIGIGAGMLRILALPLLVLGYSTFVNQIYQSLGFVLPATLLASCRQGIFFIPLVLLLPSFFGLAGIQWTQAIADVLTFLVSVPFHVLIYKKILPTGKTAAPAPVKNEESTEKT